MPGVPMFVEVPETRKVPETRICSKAVDILLNKEIGPVGSAGTIEEVQSILEELKEHDLSPAIFVINTFGAKAILPALEPLIGGLPVLYLRRRLFAGKSGLYIRSDIPRISSRRMKAITEATVTRETSMWYYGGKHSDEIAKRVATAVLRFLQDGDFLHIERGRPTVISDRELEA